MIDMMKFLSLIKDYKEQSPFAWDLIDHLIDAGEPMLAIEMIITQNEYRLAIEEMQEVFLNK